MAKRLPGRDLLSLSAAADAIEAQEQAERDYPRTYFEECKVRGEIKERPRWVKYMGDDFTLV